MISQLMEATQPSRYLDAMTEIKFYGGKPSKIGNRVLRGLRIPHYTSSVDAVLVLVGAFLPKWDWTLNGSLAILRLGHRQVQASHDTPAMALLIATLIASEDAC